MSARRILRLMVIATIIAVAAGACTQSSGPPNRVVDSAGVRIVINSRPTWAAGAEWTVSPRASLRLPAAGNDSTPELLTVEGAFRTSDGSIIVGDRGASAVRFFDRAGKLVRTVGREGQGPGEFEYLSWMQACGGDSAFALDNANGLVTVLGPDGRLGRRFSINTPEPGHSPFTTRCRRNGSILAAGWGSSEARPERPYRPVVPVSVAGPDGAVRADLGRFPGTEMAPEFRGATVRRLGRWLVLGLGDSTAWVATNESSEFRGFDRRSGALRMLVRTPSVEHPVSSADWEFHRRRAIDSSDSEARRERVRNQFKATEPPKRFPSFLNLVVDADNDLWFQPFPRVEDSVPRWLVFRADGVFLGSVALPASLRILEIGTNYVLGAGQDSTGAPYVALHDLRRR